MPPGVPEFRPFRMRQRWKRPGQRRWRGAPASIRWRATSADRRAPALRAARTTGRPRMGWPSACRCTRSWWVRPVTGSSSSRVASPAASKASTRQRVWLGLPCSRSTMRRGRFGQSAASGRSISAQPSSALRRVQPARNHREVALAHLALRERLAEAALHRRAPSHQHQARRCHVQAVHHPGIRIQPLHPGRSAVLLVLAAAGHAQQPGGLVDHQQLRVGMEDGRESSRTSRHPIIYP